MGSFRFRRSRKIAPGVRLNWNKKSVGVSVGGKYLRKTFNSNSRKTTTVGTPVKGLYYTKSNSSAKKEAKHTSQSEKKVAAVKAVKKTEPDSTQKPVAPLLKSEKVSIGAIAVLLFLVGFMLALVIGVSMSDNMSDSISKETTTEKATVLATDVFEKDDGSLWVVIDGFISKDYHGVLRSDAGNWYYVKDGVVQTSYTGVQSNKYGAWAIKNGAVNFSENGLLTSEGEQYFIKDGKVATGINGILKTAAGWLFFSNGKVDTQYEGVSTNDYGTWYVKGGKVQFDYDGTITLNGSRYTVEGGRAYADSSQNTASQTYNKKSINTTADYESPDYTGPQDAGGSEDQSYLGYWGNSNTMVFHNYSCSAISKTKNEHLVTAHPREWYIDNGYRPCERCHP